MNNIFYIEGESKGVLGDQYTPEKDGKFNITNIIFENNLFLRSENWPVEVPIKDTFPLIGDPEFSNENGMSIIDYIPKNKELIMNKGNQIVMISNDQVGLTIGLKVTHDILGNKITGNPDLGAIELSTGDN